MKKINETLKMHTPVFDVVEKEFDSAKFKPVGLNCNDWVMVAIKDSKTNDFIFVRQTRWGLEDKTLEFPCGTVDDDEVKKHGRKNARMLAALREVEEETGIEVSGQNVEELATFNPNPAYFNNTMSIFFVEVDNLREVFAKRGDQNLDENEDCVVYVKNLDDPAVAKHLMSHAMGLCAYGLLVVNGKMAYA